MFKERLCKEQPIAYKILENALISEHYAHAYLLVGEKGTPKKETAILLAQSLLCDEKASPVKSATHVSELLNIIMRILSLWMVRKPQLRSRIYWEYKKSLIKPQWKLKVKKFMFCIMLKMQP